MIPLSSKTIIKIKTLSNWHLARHAWGKLRKTFRYGGNTELWWEGVEIEGYWKNGDSFIIKHPTTKSWWCVSRSFIKELAEFKPK